MFFSSKTISGFCCSKLTKSLVNVSLIFQTLISEKCQNFLLEKYEELWHCKSFSRVHTEIGNQNSRTFPGLFKDYLHFFQESFFIDGNSPNTAYTQDFCPIQDCKRISLSGSLFHLCVLSMHATFVFAFPDFRFVRFHFRLHLIRIT